MKKCTCICIHFTNFTAQYLRLDPWKWNVTERPPREITVCDWVLQLRHYHQRKNSQPHLFSQNFILSYLLFTLFQLLHWYRYIRNIYCSLRNDSSFLAIYPTHFLNMCRSRWPWYCWWFLHCTSILVPYVTSEVEVESASGFYFYFYLQLCKTASYLCNFTKGYGNRLVREMWVNFYYFAEHFLPFHLCFTPTDSNFAERAVNFRPGPI